MSPTFKRPPLLLGAARQFSRLHRWLGTAVCLMFALWFGTGVIMMYVPFPSLSEPARLAATAPLDLSALAVAPSGAAQAAADVPLAGLRLVAVLGQPRYLLTLADGRMLAISGTDAGPAPPLEVETARRVAEQFAQLPAAAVDGPFDYDQWVVHQRFDPARPFFRVSLGDRAGTELYVSARLGQVLQRTTRFERGWNWVGAVVHWIYPTVLRKSEYAWDQVVWWLALIGIVAALAGFGLGIVRLLNQCRSGRGGLSPFRGWLRWHHILGLCAGTFVLTWIFSGWLSMDHGRLFSRDQAEPERNARMRGIDLATAVRGLTPETIRTLGPARELEFLAVGGQALIAVRGGADSRYPLRPLQRGALGAAIGAVPDQLLLAAARQAWAPVPALDIATIAADDAYGHTRSDPLPPSARRIRLDDADATWVHVDATSGRIISLMDHSRRVYRWLFTGLHTFDFPLLNRAGPLWQVLMICALALGFCLSVSAVVLGGRRIGKSFKPWLRPRSITKEIQ
ncbi:MAG TPA: PepSY domain-containing protein [Janthinobacterium sp.]|nr:PepSY domain-containing protein [Janthinobacterium sp.]